MYLSKLISIESFELELKRKFEKMSTEDSRNYSSPVRGVIDAVNTTKNISEENVISRIRVNPTKNNPYQRARYFFNVPLSLDPTELAVGDEVFVDEWMGDVVMIANYTTGSAYEIIKELSY